MIKIGEKFLLDSFKISGNEYPVFKEVVTDMDAVTKELIAYSKEITFLSLCNLPEYQQPGKVAFYVLSEGIINGFLKFGNKFQVGLVPESEIGAELLDELRNTTGLIAIIHDQKYIISDISIPLLCMRASISGNLTINRQNFVRNLHLADALFSKNEKIHFIYREYPIAEKSDGTVVTAKKIFSALGGKYAMIPQDILIKMEQAVTKEGVLGRTEIKSWTVDHEFTDLFIEFPDAAKDFVDTYKLKEDVIPGLFLCTSDIGKSSVIVRGTYRIGRHYIITDEVMMKHTSKHLDEDGKVNVEKIVSDISDTIFSNIRKLPETLMELIGQEVLDYKKIDLSTEEGSAANFLALKNIYEKVLNKEFDKILPAKKRAALLECMCDEINTSIPYTFYDVATNFMSIPERIEGICRTTLIDLRKVCAKVPYTLLRKDFRKTKEENGILLL